MLLRQPLINRRRQKEPGLAVDRPEVAHRRNILEKRSKRALILSGPSRGVKSDRLLAAERYGMKVPSAATLSASQFRRTLAWFIARQPFGIIAGKLQYKHTSTLIFE